MIEAQINQTKKPRTQRQDRITLSTSANKKSDLWLKQIKETFSGMISLKRTEIVCAIIEDLPDILPTHLLEKIKENNLTDLQKAKWIYQRLKEAKGSDDLVNFDGLVKAAQFGTRKRSGNKRTGKNKKEHLKISQNHSDNLKIKNVTNTKSEICT